MSAEVITASRFFCDDRELAVRVGALGGVGLSSEHIAAELGEVISGAHEGRSDEDQVTVFGGVGLPFQDAVAAWAIYRLAISAGVGQEIDFLG